MADEAGFGKTIKGALVPSQFWWSLQRNLLLVVSASLRKQWATELLENFLLPSDILYAKRLKDITASGRTRPIGRGESIVILSCAFAARMADAIRMVPWHLVVFDKAQKRRNVTGCRSARRAGRSAEAPADGHAAPEQSDETVLAGCG